MDHIDTGQAGGQIEVTEKMKIAGVLEMLAWLGDVVPETTPFSNGRIVAAVFSSMVEASEARC